MRAMEVRRKRERGEITCPTTIRRGIADQPYLRCDSAEIRAVLASGMQRMWLFLPNWASAQEQLLIRPRKDHVLAAMTAPQVISRQGAAIDQ